jgi:hypothetical protein
MQHYRAGRLLILDIFFPDPENDSGTLIGAEMLFQNSVKKRRTAR